MALNDLVEQVQIRVLDLGDGPRHVLADAGLENDFVAYCNFWAKGWSG